MSQTTGTFPALTDGYKKKRPITPLPVKKLSPPPPTPKKKAR